MDKNRHMEELVERFLDGRTTNAEERELYNFFAGGEVPAHLEPYRKMFVWYDGGLAGEEAVLPMAVPRPRRRFVKAAAAAATAMAAMISVVMLHEPAAAETYIERYMIRDGVVITDPEIVAAEMKTMRTTFDEQMRNSARMDCALDEMASFKS
jgi:hypothetical protein